MCVKNKLKVISMMTNILKKIYTLLLKGYQYFSKMFPANCRYYPTCSEYAKWQFEFNVPHKAFLASSSRILRCNQLFRGGIDYPLVEYTPQKHTFIESFNPYCGKINIEYWLVPQNTAPPRYYYVIKDYDAIKRTS